MIEGIIKISGSLLIAGIGLGLIAGSLIIIVVTIQPIMKSIKEKLLD